MKLLYAVSKDKDDWYPINFQDDGLRTLPTAETPQGELLDAVKKKLARADYTLEESPPAVITQLSKADDVRDLMRKTLDKDIVELYLSKVLSAEASLLLQLLRKI